MGKAARNSRAIIVGLPSRAAVDRLTAMRQTGESYSDVILRLVDTSLT